MTRCPSCATDNPAAARYCMQCGRLLPVTIDDPRDDKPMPGGFSAFTLSIVASLGITLILVFVFRLPIFFLAGFLPLLWWKRKP